MIGFLDSGVGGLAALSRLCRHRPGAACVYMADTAFLPYGEKDAVTLAKRAETALAFFCREKASAVLFACGTLSAVALPHLSPRGLPVFGVLAPAVDAAARATECGRVLVLATEASVTSGAYPRALAARGIRTRQIACPRFVPLCESGHTAPDDPLLREAVAQTLPQGCEDGADTVLLGCTHYTWLVPALQRRFPGAALIDAAGEAVRACLAALPETAENASPGAVCPPLPEAAVPTACPDTAAHIFPETAPGAEIFSAGQPSEKELPPATEPPSATKRPPAPPTPETEDPARRFCGCRFVCTGDAAAFARAASSLLKFPVRVSSVSL